MISKVYNKLFQINIIKGLIVLSSLVFFMSLINRYIQQDEPWFGEQAYWLVTEGNVKLKSMPGIFNWDTNMLIYHKLFVWAGAVIVATLGWNLYFFKSLVLLLFIFTGYLLYRVTRKNAP
ncbi:MAG: hypothetical protein R3345_14475, partial [Fulvivirga sp.]|nr:hypothetical protein [Fulvivirga sp.]